VLHRQRVSPGVAVIASVQLMLNLRSESFGLGLLGESFAAVFVVVVAPAHLPTLPALLAGLGCVSVND
jgi:hypothetical protein